MLFTAHFTGLGTAAKDALSASNKESSFAPNFEIFSLAESSHEHELHEQ